MTSSIVHPLILVTMFLLCMPVPSAADAAPCNSSCGSITNIGFPFSLNNSHSGVNQSCPSSYMNNPYLQLFCDQAEGKLYALHETSDFTRLEVISIGNDSLIVRLADPRNMGRAEMTPNGSSCTQSESSDILLPPVGIGPYVISDENKFGSFGCTVGNLYTSDVNGNFTDFYYSDHAAVGGCVVLLPDNRNNPDCGNRTCCVVSLPPATDLHLRAAVYLTDYTLLKLNKTDPECSNCSNNYASLFYPNSTDFNNSAFPIKILWALPVNMTDTTSDPTTVLFEKEVNETIIKSPDSACAKYGTSESIPVLEVQGYRCKCKDGFVGDGYANGSGCTNVNECEDSLLNTCVHHMTCEDSFGSYKCSCYSPFNFGNGRIDGSGCKLQPWIRKMIIILSSSLGFLIIILIMIKSLMCWVKTRKRKNFIQNGGIQLQEFMRSKGNDHALPKLFTSSELKIATNNYADDMKIGTGGFGVVYKGKLKTGKLVAIKMELVPKDGGNKEFLNEVMILTQIHHKHIVKLLGCCLETKTPLLVYEYASNGTLADHLQETANSGYVMGWEQRLNVAIQTAEALSYLHRAASPPILHRDIKSANILLDDHCDAKVGDFGVSRLVPDGEKHISTVVQGTLGYLDPEYFQTLQLTDKSDVYSMGVILVELITSLKPVDAHQRDPKFSNLALLFIHHMKGGILDQIIDPRLLEITDHSVPISPECAWRLRSSILGVASIAHRCLALMGTDRPSMMEVEHLLHEISCKLHATRTPNMDEGITVALPQPSVIGAVTMENNEYMINSDDYYSTTSNPQNEDMSTHLLR